MGKAADELTSRIMAAVSARWPKHVRLWRTPNHPLRLDSGAYIPVSMKGISDVCGIFFVPPRNSRFVAIEVKVKDKLSDAQKIFLDIIRRYGGIAIEGRSPEQVIRDMEALIDEDV